MLRAENAHMRRKLQEEIVLNSSFETVQPRVQVNERVHHNESSQTKKRLLETSGGFLQEHLLESICSMML